ncbi:MAG: hypothetical protein KAH72_00620 [Flavobacteriaceae bacterium]|nr:hypothetical protein [Flavobacteriaceae bacterium]
MKNSFMAIFFLFFAINTQAQSYDGKGDIKLSVGFDLYGNGNGIKTTFDYGLCDLFSIGVGASFYLSNDENDYFVYGRTNIHLGMLLDFPSQLDIYPGIEIGYLSSNDIGFTGYLGVRYFFTKKIGVFAEIGNNGAIGLSIDF